MGDVSEVLGVAMRAGEMTIRLLEFTAHTTMELATLIHKLFTSRARGPQVPVHALSGEQLAAPVLIRTEDLAAFREAAGRLQVPFAAVKGRDDSERLLLFAAKNSVLCSHALSLSGITATPLPTAAAATSAAAGMQRKDEGILSEDQEGTILCTLTVPEESAGRFVACAKRLDLVCEGTRSGGDLLVVLPQPECARAERAWNDAGIYGRPHFVCAARMTRYRESLASRVHKAENTRNERQSGREQERAWEYAPQSPEAGAYREETFMRRSEPQRRKVAFAPSPIPGHENQEQQENHAGQPQEIPPALQHFIVPDAAARPPRQVPVRARTAVPRTATQVRTAGRSGRGDDALTR